MLDINQLIQDMTLEEKVKLLSGENYWQTTDISRLEIPKIMMNDGPHGMRVQGGQGDHLGIHSSLPSTCYPTGSALACSWDPELVHHVAKTIAVEAKSLGVSIVLGPAANIKRSPICGRNFEYFSEDPTLSSIMATAHVKGIQSQGIGASLKHFVANNQEHDRLTVDAIIDERTLREVYLSSFENVVKEAQPWTVMCAYNKINGLHVSEHPHFLREILKDEWGHEGVTLSDWGAVNDRVAGLKAGLELEMPGNQGQNDAFIIEAVQNGRLSIEVVDEAVRRLLVLIDKAVLDSNEPQTFDQPKHHQVAIDAARECGVLLKNEGQILPLSAEDRLLIVGEFATYTRYQGGGSSHVNATRVDHHLDELKKLNPGLRYEQGFDIQLDEVDMLLVDRAVQAAKEVDKIICYLGLPDHYESEGFDRTHMRLPENQLHLMEALSQVTDQLVVVLSNGSVVELPFLEDISGLLEMYLGGQGVAVATTQLLFGEENPSGRLAETWPKQLEHNPSYLNFPGHQGRVTYAEGLYVGYKYYDKKQMEVNFPFGYGLSYTSFSYDSLKVSGPLPNGDVTCTIKVTNTGNREGKEVVQVYVSDLASTYDQPIKRLGGFAKVNLSPGASETVTIILPKRAFSFYHVDLKKWVLESGAFQILVGSNAEDLYLEELIHIDDWQAKQQPFHYNTLLKEIMANPEAMAVFNHVAGQAGHMPNMADASDEEKKIMEAMMGYTPLRGLVLMSQGAVTYEQVDQLIDALNQTL